MPLVVVLDANVLYPIALTDFFLTVAGRGLFRPHWSTEILREIERNLLKNQPALTTAMLAYRLSEMNRCSTLTLSRSASSPSAPRSP